MPSPVSMPPNIMTAAFETTSAGLSVSVASARTPLPCPIVLETCRSSVRTAASARGPISPPTDTRSTAATISSYQPRTADGSVSTRSSAAATTSTASGPARSRRISALPRGASDATSDRAASWTRAVNRVATSGLWNAVANGSRWRRCSVPSSDSMLGPTTCAVEKRGSSTVKRSASRITSMHRSRRVTSQPPRTGSQATGSTSRRRASRSYGRPASTSSVTVAPNPVVDAPGGAVLGP